MTEYIDNDEIIEDENDDIITLVTPDGEEIEFQEIAGIAHGGDFYAIVQPVVLLEGMSEDEALVFKVTRNENGDDQFTIELDDEIITAVFNEYYKLLDNLNNDEEEE